MIHMERTVHATHDLANTLQETFLECCVSLPYSDMHIYLGMNNK